MTGLLVSVRSTTEAAAALEGGADIIDVKEPTHGSLGRAPDAVVADIVRYVGGRRPVSAALGEALEHNEGHVPAGLTFAKWGLAGAGRDWNQLLARAWQTLPAATKPVMVAYADWQRAGAPPLDEVVSSVNQPGDVLLVDTFVKDDSTLLDWLPRKNLAKLAENCRRQGIRLALAGRLDWPHIPELVSLAPAWLAVRTLVCAGATRENTIAPDRVRKLKSLLNSRPAPSSASLSPASRTRQPAESAPFRINSPHPHTPDDSKPHAAG